MRKVTGKIKAEMTVETKCERCGTMGAYVTLMVVLMVVMVVVCIWVIWLSAKHAEQRKNMTPEEKMADSLNTMVHLEAMRMFNNSWEKFGNSFKRK